MKRWMTLLGSVGGLTLAATAAAGAPPAAAVRVFVSVPPQKYFVQRIGGARVAVEVMVPPGGSPATYEPSGRQMARLSDADLYFSIGVPFERGLLPRIRTSVPGLRVVDVLEGIRLREMESGPCHEHAGHDHEAHEQGTDPHAWTDPKRVQVMARTIQEALVKADPAGREGYAAHLREFLRELEVLAAELGEMLGPVKGRTLLVFHPSWGYLADAYGLRQQAIEVEGKTPTARQLARTMEAAGMLHAKAVFVQPQFDQRTARAVADALDGEVVVIDPLAENYPENMRTVARRIRDALQQGERQDAR